MDSGLHIQGATIRFGSLVVLDQQTLELPRGKSLVISGENGVGKTTLLYLAAGLVAADEGTVTLDGHTPDPLRPSALFRHGVRRGFVFQQGGLLSNLSALANVALALRYHADVLQLDDDAIDARARRALADVQVAETNIHSLPGHLSFGLRKRVALARAMAIEPNFVFFDDPDSGLDEASEAIVHGILRRYRDDPAVTMLVASNHRVLLNRLDLPPWELVDGTILEGVSRSLR